MPDDKVQAYMMGVASTVVDAKKEVIEALELIARHVGGVADARPVQLLALRRYLRLGGTKVHANWAWTPEQAQQFASTGGGKLLANEAAKVQRQFAADNPGYTLVVSPLRNLERQVRLWNANNSVHRAGARLLADMAKELADEEEFPAVPTGESLVKFKVVLRSAPVTPEPTSAAPGTSDHGQSRAVDFAVARGRTIVAGTSSASIQRVWKQGGWEAKLIAATAGTQLVGPLQHPYEPWHWRLGHR